MLFFTSVCQGSRYEKSADSLHKTESVTVRADATVKAGLGVRSFAHRSFAHFAQIK